MNNRFLKEDNQSVYQQQVDIEAVFQRIKEFNSLANSNKLADDDATIAYAHNLIEKYREYNTEEAKKYTVEKQIPVRDILTSFATSLKQVFPEKYDSEFNPIFSKVQISPMPSGKPSDSEAEPSTPTSPDENQPESGEPESGEPESGEPKSGEPETPSDKTFHPDSIIDYLDSIGIPSDFESRKIIAQNMRIPEYRGTASQNLLMLSTLKDGKTEVSPNQAGVAGKVEASPQIDFAGSKQNAYVDKGGGRYAPASADELADPKIQLYVKNPKKGQGEYMKPNYVKVRREGNGIRRQSQFGGALGSLSNLFGDIGNTISGKTRSNREEAENSEYTRNRDGTYTRNI